MVADLRAARVRVLIELVTPFSARSFGPFLLAVRAETIPSFLLGDECPWNPLPTTLHSVVFYPPGAPGPSLCLGFFNRLEPGRLRVSERGNMSSACSRTDAVSYRTTT